MKDSQRKAIYAKRKRVLQTQICDSCENYAICTNGICDKCRGKNAKKFYAVVGHSPTEAGILDEYGEMTEAQALKKAKMNYPNTKDFEIVNVHDSEDRIDLT